MAEHALDALVVSGSEYSGFEGAVTYLTGFQIVHRYAYAVVPADGEPFVVFPSEARYVGEHGTALIEQRFDPHPGAAIAAAAKDAGWRRIGVYGLDYVMTVRDYRPLEGFDIVPFDVEFDLARAVKSEPSSRACATRCGSTGAASRSGRRRTRPAGPRPR